jgi:hypothetical protein
MTRIVSPVSYYDPFTGGDRELKDRGTSFAQDMSAAIVQDLDKRFRGGERSGPAWDALQAWKSSPAPTQMEQVLTQWYRASVGEADIDPAIADRWKKYEGTAYAYRGVPVEFPSLERVLSAFVIDPMGYEPNKEGDYGLGELAFIYQNTPARTVAKAISEFQERGEDIQAAWTEALYGGTMRTPEPRTSQQDVEFPLREDRYAPIRTCLPQLRTGQRDIQMDPGLVTSLLQQRAIGREGATRRRYKGGTKVSGILGTARLGKQTLGG